MINAHKRYVVFFSQWSFIIPRRFHVRGVRHFNQFSHRTLLKVLIYVRRKKKKDECWYVLLHHLEDILREAYRGAWKEMIKKWWMFSFNSRNSQQKNAFYLVHSLTIGFFIDTIKEKKYGSFEEHHKTRSKDVLLFIISLRNLDTCNPFYISDLLRYIHENKRVF